jgi:hypothetical protein
VSWIDTLSPPLILTSWLEASLNDASRLNLSVYLIGHQPFTTKEGHDEMEVTSIFYGRLKTILSAYSSIIKVGLFGHHNYAFVEEIMSTSFFPLIPSIVAPGISPRGKNNPAFHVISRSKETGTILDFKQIKFDLFSENQRARVLNQPDYLGQWSFYSDHLYSWQTLRFVRVHSSSSHSNSIYHLVVNKISQLRLYQTF